MQRIPQWTQQQDLSPHYASLLLRMIIILYLALGVFYAVKTPPWQAPDEPAHYNNIVEIAETGRLPIMEVGEYPAAYLEVLKSARFAPELSIDSVRYEAHQPPLYYLLGAVVYRLARSLGRWPTWLVLRCFSLTLGALGLLACFKCVRAVYPQRPGIALATTAFAATVPMHLTMTSSINNDALVGLLVNYLAWRMLAMHPGQWTPRRAIGIGALLGLSLLCKLQTYAALAISIMALLMDASVFKHKRGPDRQSPWVLGALMVGTALVVASPWLIRNMFIYGPADPLGLVRHNQVVIGQLTTQQYIIEHGSGALLLALVRTTFQSFWAQFGWMAVPIHPRIYIALALLCATATGGLILYGAREARFIWADPRRRRTIVLLLVWLLSTLGGYVWWNLQYVQHQGRYLFPALVPIALAFNVGLSELLRLRWYVAPAVATALAVLLVGLGLVSGDVQWYGILIILFGGALVSGAGWLQKRQPGAPAAILYSSMAMLAAICVPLYIVPYLSP